MDAVKSFNQELSSLYEIKPPISKAKMTSITKGAIKAIKFYKHVVQSVEKFIQKCRPEYKIPGLYVIDSLVRQSRHQFGSEKDVFAPRFAKNINATFHHLYKCPEEEKSKIIRVLNLWQKNAVFSSDVIQPLFDLANPSSDMAKSVEEIIKRGNEKKSLPGAITLVAPESIINPQNLNSSPQGAPLVDQHVIQHLQTIQQLLKNHSPHNTSGETVKFNKKVLDDFDYSDEEDALTENEHPNQPPPAMIEALQGILGNERVLQQLKNMGAISNSQIQQLQQLLSSSSHFSPHLGGGNSGVGVSSLPSSNASGPAHHSMPPPASHHPWNTPKIPQQQIITLELEEGERAETDEDIQIVEDRSGRRSRSRDRSKRRRSRSRSPGRRKSRRSRSRSRDRNGRRRERDEEREKRKEREKKGLPPIKKEHLSVCSTTLWVGHLSRLVAEDHLSDIFGEYGEIVSIDLIPPRGCAFVCMNRRMDAAKALKSLYKYKINNKPIILAWAPGKGMKDKQWKDYWDVDLGVSYIPINKLDPQVNMADLEEGGMFDEDTMPEWMKTMRGVAPNAAAAAAAAQGTSPAAAAALNPPAAAPQFIPVPEGIPPGLEHFGMPIPPPNVLLAAPPRFGRPPPPPPIPGGFDASQPPPGLRRIAFPPPPMLSSTDTVLSAPPGPSSSLIEEGGEDWPAREIISPNNHPPQHSASNKDEDIASRLRSLAGGSGIESIAAAPNELPPFDALNGGGKHNESLTDGDFGGGSGEPIFNNGERFFGNSEFNGPPDFHHGPRHRGGGRGGGRQFENWNAGGGGAGGPPPSFDARGHPPHFRGHGGRRGRGNHHPGDRWMDHERFEGFPPPNMSGRPMPPWAANEGPWNGGNEGPWIDGPHRRGRGGRGGPPPRGGSSGSVRGFDRELNNGSGGNNSRFGEFEQPESNGQFFEGDEGNPDEMRMPPPSHGGEESMEVPSEHGDNSSREERRKNRKSRWGEQEEQSTTAPVPSSSLYEDTTHDESNPDPVTQEQSFSSTAQEANCNNDAPHNQTENSNNEETDAPSPPTMQRNPLYEAADSSSPPPTQEVEAEGRADDSMNIVESSDDHPMGADVSNSSPSIPA